MEVMFSAEISGLGGVWCRGACRTEGLWYFVRMAQSPQLPNRVVKVTLPEEVFQALRQRAFVAEIAVAGYVRKLIERHLLGSPVEGEGEQSPEETPSPAGAADGSTPSTGGSPSRPEPVDKVVDLMGKLEASVAAAKDARVRHKAGPTPCPKGTWQSFPSGAICSVCRVPKDRHE